MSLRDFLLDYAEKAPKAKRRKNTVLLRFNGTRCPLELAAGDGLHWHDAAERYGIDDDTAELIAAAADRGKIPRHQDKTDEHYLRAILEKLAEPDGGAR